MTDTSNTATATTSELENLVDCIREALDYAEYGAAYALAVDLNHRAPLTAEYWFARTADAYRSAF